MKNNNTKPVNVQTENTADTADDLQRSTDAASRFLDRFGIVKLLVDDTPLPKCGKAMELVSKYFNHVTMGYEYGYKISSVKWNYPWILKLIRIQ